MHRQVYNNNGMPLSAAISIPIGAVVVVALLLALARCQRKRTERCVFRHVLSQGSISMLFQCLSVRESTGLSAAACRLTALYCKPATPGADAPLNPAGVRDTCQPGHAHAASK